MDAAVQPGAVIVHFGMPKTGSTSIQRTLYKHLADERFYYLDLGKANASLGLANCFKSDPGTHHVHVKEGTTPAQLREHRRQALERLDAELAVAGARTAIVSGGGIATFKAPELERMSSALARQRSAVTLAGYVRRPKEFMESAFQQAVKAGSQQLAASTLLPRYYTRLLPRLDEVMGRERVRLWLFDPRAFPGKCVVQDFCSRLGITWRGLDVERKNEGLSLQGLSLLFAYRKFGPGYGVGPNVLRENRMLINRLRRLEGGKVRFHSSLVAPVLEAHRADIEWMESRLGASLVENLAADDAQGIRSEADLLRFTPDSLQWLAGQLGPEYAKRCTPEMSPQAVAEWMHQLRLKLAADRAREQAA